MERSLQVQAMLGQVIVEVDLADMGEVAKEGKAGIIIPAKSKRETCADAIWGTVSSSGIEGVGPGDEIVFDRIDGFRMEHDLLMGDGTSEKMVYFSVFSDGIRGLLRVSG